MTDHEVLATAQRIGSRALAWLDASHETGFGALDDNVTIDIADPNNAYKPIGECALAASLVLREGVTGPADADRARRMLAFGWAQLRDGNLLYERQLRHMLMTDPLEVYAHFVRAGYRHPALEELVRSLGELRSVHAAETAPNRRLAIANARRVAGLDHRGPDWAHLTAATWLGATPEPWALDWFTGYDITHTVFHLTDWGARPEDLPEPLRAYVRDWLPVWLDIWLEVGQWDLAAELLVVDSCIGEPVTGREGWEALAAVQREDGLIPRDNAQPVAEEPEQAFKDHEHTAVVAVVASTVTLSRALGGATAAVG
ncbi:DUF6895 family protein [Streptomyces rubellomurinus]|uniref:DUF6895 domain-containing protein n=1 Tax=Streptomyces rubellomurinus (strain ATCC 31215) TaxID=359131 RepID=A0A0F2THM4_STRR3|nr:hypothetical protein [Streptomyces rubellomurinus]KJS62753.1 hypothetical protein VM95_07215 [Streptomyces rubellomurinus]